MSNSAIEIINEQKLVQLSAARVVRLLEFVLRKERAVGRGISVLVTDDRRIAKLHKDYLNDPTPTDVISFGLPKGAPEAAGKSGHLGDLVVSAQTAKRVAPDFDQTAVQELERYCVHGTLHLLGYDDHKPADYKKMHAAQEKYLAEFNRVRSGR